MANHSLIRIKRELLAFAARHGQITEARYCKPFDLLEGGDVKYPVLFFDYASARKDRQELVMTFNCWIADLLHPEKDNEAEIHSDTTSIACDVIAFLDADYEREYLLNDGITIRPFTESDGDNLAGVAFDFTVRMPYSNNTCIAPEKPGIGFYLITETGSYIRTEKGERVLLETATGLLITESGEYLTTEDGFKLIPE